MTDFDSPISSASEEEKNEMDQLHIDLMLRVKEGDTAAFEELMEIHQHSVIGTVAKMLGSPAEAEDIAQQVFIRVWKSAERYEPQAKFTTWLFTITRNLVFNEVRRRKRKPALSMDEREEEFHLMETDHRTISPDKSLLQGELESAIDEAIAALPEKQRLAMILRRFEEMPYEEIGQVLGITVPAVKSLLFRARSQLKENLKDYLGED
jgi:RNA polymerase sigma-70 factor, ECF subfamily